ncbi:MAG: ABC transporter permease [Verrucomicrobia bacterium]|nr:ABC transporter permease [Verrucomicrobiota bacterium]
MIHPLDRKLLRDLSRMKGQMLAVVLVMACGLAMMIMMRSLILTLESASRSYYQSHAMADVFTRLKRAPLAAARPIESLPGVATVEARVSVDVTLDLPDITEPATGRLISLPADGGPQKLNRVFLREGRFPHPHERRAVVLGEAFANANGMRPGDSLVAVINGRRETLTVCGIGLSPEFVFEARPGETLPDHKRFGVMWMNQRSLAEAYDMDGAFNDLCIDLAPGAAAVPVLADVDRLLARYGGGGAHTRSDQESAGRIEDELRVLHSLSFAYPIVFLSVAAFMVHSVLSRIVRLQREQIAQLKALGYSSAQVGAHFLKFVLVIAALGTLVGGVSGSLLGNHLLGLYTGFFRFPEIIYQTDLRALGIALGVSLGASIIGVTGSVRQAVKLPPAEAMRPEAPQDFRPSLVERLGWSRFAGPVFLMALRNIERRPWRAAFTGFGLALATGLMVLPNALDDSVNHLLTFQWNRQQRQDAAVFLNEPTGPSGLHDLANLPGVSLAEPLRSVPAQLICGHRSRRLTLTGLPRNATLNRLLDRDEYPVDLPPDGLVMSRALGEILGAKPGDTVRVEVLDGRQPKTDVVVRGFVEDFAGLAAYMDIDALRRLLREGTTVNGAWLSVDSADWERFMRNIKETPRAAFVLVKKEQLAAFRKTTGENIGIIRRLYLMLATIVAFGVVYNSARIALSERSRELATLRVVGFTLRETRGVLMGELSVLVLLSLPFGLLFGHGLAVLVLTSFQTETVRLPLRIEPSSYAAAAAVVLTASACSFLVVSRMLARLDLVGVLKARA